MGLFGMFTSKPSSVSSGHSSVGSSHHLNKYGSAHGEMNLHELKAAERELHHAIHGQQGKAISVMLEEQARDNSASNMRHVLDSDEAKMLVKDVHRVFGAEHAEKLRAILDKRLQ
jgi:hypothetical protein